MKIQNKTMTSSQIFQLVLCVATIMIASMDIYIPAATVLVSVFGVSEYVIKWTFLIGPLSSFLFCIPIGYYSDRYGRRFLYLGSMFVFTVGAALCMVASAIELFFVGRFLLSLAAGSLSVLSGAIIADLYKGKNLAKHIAAYAAVFPATFTLAPILGGQLLTLWGWRSIFLILFISMGFFTLLMWHKLPETRHLDPMRHQNQKAFGRRLQGLVQNPRVLALALTNALPITIGALFTINSPFLFIQSYGVSPLFFSFLIAIPVIFQFLGALIYRKVVQRIGAQRSLKLGVYPCVALIIGISFCLVGFIPETPYFIIVVFCFFSCGSSFMISSAISILLDETQDEKGLMNSIISWARNGTITVLVPLASYFVDDSIAPIFVAMILIALSIIVLIHVALSRSPRENMN